MHVHEMLRRQWLIVGSTLHNLIHLILAIYVYDGGGRRGTGWKGERVKNKEKITDKKQERKIENQTEKRERVHFYFYFWRTGWFFFIKTSDLGGC